MANEPLRGCPVCGTKVKDINIGLRDFRWVADALPGRVAPMDLDCVLERRGHVLIIELKPGGAPLPLGQRLTLKNFARMPDIDVWVVWEQADGKVEAGVLDRNGNVVFVESMTVRALNLRVTKWFEEASND